MIGRAGLAALVLVTLALPLAPASAQAPAGAESCATCHLATGDDRLAAPVRAYAGDVHKAKGFGCPACHGGDSRVEGMDAMDPAKGFIGKPDHRQTVQVCGRCHSDARFMKQYNPALRVDQVAEYETSVHGRRLRELGDPKVAVCSSCHPAHSILPPSDPKSSVYPLRVAETCGRCHADGTYMAAYKIPTDQLDKYRQSVHWQTMSVKGDLSAPTCNSCHGNHGAAPPGVSWVGNVCGQCHTVQAGFFGKSVHAKAFVDLGSPGCATCHENHAIHAASDAMLGLAPGAVCAACHAAGDPGGKTAAQMRGLIAALDADRRTAAALLERAQTAGVEVSQAEFDLRGADDALVKARAAIHTFRLDAVKRDTDAGLAIAERARARGRRALDELAFRRKGLAASLVIILALIAGLVLKIRQLERGREFGPPSSRH